jgi:hypothetical protein
VVVLVVDVAALAVVDVVSPTAVNITMVDVVMSAVMDVVCRQWSVWLCCQCPMWLRWQCSMWLCWALLAWPAGVTASMNADSRLLVGEHVQHSWCSCGWSRRLRSGPSPTRPWRARCSRTHRSCGRVLCVCVCVGYML